MTLTKEYYRRKEAAEILCMQPGSVSDVFRKLGLPKRSNRYAKKDVLLVYKLRQANRIKPTRCYFAVPDPLVPKIREMVKNEIAAYRKSLIE